MRKNIVCFGDSNTWGYDPVINGRLEENERWTGLLQEKLTDGYRVYEEGLCGRTTVFEDPLNEGLSGLSYIVPCLNTHSPVDLLIVMLGTNDSKERFHATSFNIACGMKRLLLHAMNNPCWRDEPRVLLICPPPIDPRCETGMFAGEMGICAERSRGLAAEYAAVARELGVAFWDSADIAVMNTVDHMHLSRESHVRFAQKLAELVREML